MQNQTKPEITLDTHLKTALRSIVIETVCIPSAWKHGMAKRKGAAKPLSLWTCFTAYDAE